MLDRLNLKSRLHGQPTTRLHELSRDKQSLEQLVDKGKIFVHAGVNHFLSQSYVKEHAELRHFVDWKASWVSQHEPLPEVDVIIMR